MQSPTFAGTETEKKQMTELTFWEVFEECTGNHLGFQYTDSTLALAEGIADECNRRGVKTRSKDGKWTGRNVAVTLVRHFMKERHPFDKRYVRGFTVPKKILAGRVLVHNLVKHKETTPNGVCGFRAWTQLPDEEGLTGCDCGWSGLPHYRARSGLDL
jgi:hypothetical protein